jgi:hypothetical protein
MVGVPSGADEPAVKALLGRYAIEWRVETRPRPLRGPAQRSSLAMSRR